MLYKRLHQLSAVLICCLFLSGSYTRWGTGIASDGLWTHDTTTIFPINPLLDLGNDAAKSQWSYDEATDLWDFGIVRIIGSQGVGSAALNINQTSNASGVHALLLANTNASTDGAVLKLAQSGTGNDIEGTGGFYLKKDGVIKIHTATTCPATCTVGELCVDTDAAAQQKLLTCETTDSWIAQGSGAAGGDDILIDGGAVVNPNFDPGGDIIFVDTANTVTANIQASKVTNTMMADDAIGKAEMKDEDFGDWTCLTSSCTLDANVCDDTATADALTIAGGTIGTSAITLVQGAAPTPTGDGIIEWEDDDDHIIVGDGTNQVEFVPTEDVSGAITMTIAGVTAMVADQVTLTTHTAGNYADGDAEAGSALTGDTATDFFSAGVIAHERGGLQADLSAYTGLVGITGADTTVEVDTKAELETAIGDVSDFAEADGDVYAGTHDFTNSATILRIPVLTATPATCTVGQMHIDTDGNTSGDNCGASTDPQLCICGVTNTWFAVDLVP